MHTRYKSKIYLYSHMKLLQKKTRDDQPWIGVDLTISYNFLHNTIYLKDPMIAKRNTIVNQPTLITTEG